MKLLIAPAAAEELQDIAAWYPAQGSSALGSAFIDEFERTTTLLLANRAIGSTFFPAFPAIFHTPVSLPDYLSRRHGRAACARCCSSPPPSRRLVARPALTAIHSDKPAVG